MIVETRCPFCGKKIEVNADAEIPYVIHRMPFCEEYAKSADALEFVVKVNRFLKASA